MEHIITCNLDIHYPKNLEQGLMKTIEAIKNKIPLWCNIFNCSEKDIPTIQTNIFNTRKDFQDYVKSIAPDGNLSTWANGCFYNDGIQLFIAEEQSKDIFKILVHELCHKYIDCGIYKKYNIKDITWFDESLANTLDDSSIARTKNEWKQNAISLKETYYNFDLNVLNDWHEVEKIHYDAYEMFRIVGKYIIDNKLEKSIIQKLIKNPQNIIKLGKTLLATALDYFINNY